MQKRVSAMMMMNVLLGVTIAKYARTFLYFPLYSIKLLLFSRHMNVAIQKGPSDVSILVQPQPRPLQRVDHRQQLLQQMLVKHLHRPEVQITTGHHRQHNERFMVLVMQDLKEIPLVHVLVS